MTSRIPGARSRPAGGELHFAPMRLSDVPEVVEIERRAFAAPWSDRLFLHEFEVEFSRVELVRVGDAVAVVGYACWWIVAGEGQILNLAVGAARRGMGIGSALVGRIVDDCVSAGAGVVRLEVRAENRAALALYRGCGFEPVGERPDYYGPGRHAVLMDRVLPDAVFDPRGIEPS